MAVHNLMQWGGGDIMAVFLPEWCGVLQKFPPHSIDIMYRIIIYRPKVSTHFGGTTGRVGVWGAGNRGEIKGESRERHFRKESNSGVRHDPPQLHTSLNSMSC